MAQGLSRRKTSALVSFLTQTVTNTTISHRVRTAASVRLQELYQHGDLLHERAEVRKDARERATLAALPAIAAQPAPAIPLTEEERKRQEDEAKDLHTAQIFAAVLGKGKGGDNAAR